jgi:hypothetical protein
MVVKSKHVAIWTVVLLSYKFIIFGNAVVLKVPRSKQMRLHCFINMWSGSFLLLQSPLAMVTNLSHIFAKTHLFFLRLYSLSFILAQLLFDFELLSFTVFLSSFSLSNVTAYIIFSVMSIVLVSVYCEKSIMFLYRKSMLNLLLSRWMWSTVYPMVAMCCFVMN